MDHPQPQKPYYARVWPPAAFSGDYLQGEMRKTSNAFANCSHGKVLCVASGFAMGGALASILGQYLEGGGMFWIVWIFFCVMVIPLVHSLSRQILELRKRLDTLEARIKSADQPSES